MKKILSAYSFFIIFIISSLSLPIRSEASENQINDYLISQPPQEQADLLGQGIGEGCEGETAFYMGSKDAIKQGEPNPGDLLPSAEREHDAYWSVRCKNGKSYLSIINAEGHSKIFDCSEVEAKHAGRCFKKLQ